MPDSPEPEVKRDDLLRLTSEITAAHVSNNTVALADLPALIEQVYRTLATVGAGSENVPDRPIPAVPVKKSVRSEEHTSELQSLMRISYAVFCLKKTQQIRP